MLLETAKYKKKKDQQSAEQRRQKWKGHSDKNYKQKNKVTFQIKMIHIITHKSLTEINCISN